MPIAKRTSLRYGARGGAGRFGYTPSVAVPSMRLCTLVPAALLLALAPLPGHTAGDPDKGRALAIAHCTRCHVVGEQNPTGGIGSTPSFQVLRTMKDWPAAVRQFLCTSAASRARPHRRLAGVDAAAAECTAVRPFHRGRRSHSGLRADHRACMVGQSTRFDRRKARRPKPYRSCRAYVSARARYCSARPRNSGPSCAPAGAGFTIAERAHIMARRAL